ncbi:uncharacterized protein LOC125944799 [Dermacentor silvarum]|uniref:uncharacterized protein LOC125944799 n=1 Tax=Dermacentor silvarum TaxID=543639 RepID=UPI002101A719|nr:uncharacterized protein LOC125944799 [Dermacentor silvarum]
MTDDARIQDPEYPAQLFKSVVGTDTKAVGHRIVYRAVASGPWPPVGRKTLVLLTRQLYQDVVNEVTLEQFEGICAALSKLSITFAEHSEYGRMTADGLKSAVVPAGDVVSRRLEADIMERYQHDTDGTIGFDDFVRAWTAIEITKEFFEMAEQAEDGRAAVTWSRYFSFMLSKSTDFIDY